MSKEMKYGEKNIKKYALTPDTWDTVGVGMLLTKIEFWAHHYDFSFQFWGPGNNNVFINKHSVELTSTGGYDTIEELFEFVLQWCEKANPGIKYPEVIIGKPIDLPD
jgi:hypothetical protein